MDLELKKIRKKQIKRIIIIMLIVVVITIPSFIFFRINSESRLTLREARNVKLALEMLDTELYANGISIFDSTKPDGLKGGVSADIKEILNVEGAVSLHSYDKINHKIFAFTYRKGKYEVIYKYDAEKGDTWEVNYLFRVMNIK